MNILVMNCGSSSLKFQLIDSLSEQILARGLCERIGMEGSRLLYEPTGQEKIITDLFIENHLHAVRLVLDELVDPGRGVLHGLNEIGAVGHRIVHGGERFAGSVLISDEVIEATEACSDLAPLHNPANLVGVRACLELMPHTPMVGVYDTAFHQSMPEEAYLYGIPYEYYETYGIRRYGFHGTSHAYVSGRAAELLNQDREGLKIIVCHLGNGASVTAVKNGKSVDTSMGLTPLEGLMMGTRSGDLDPAIIGYLTEKEGKTVKEIIDILNKKSGMLGLQKSGSSDFRDILHAYREGEPGAVRTLKAYIYRIAKYIGSYVAAMNGVDVICFTAGIGENSSFIREKVCEYLEFLGVILDPAFNNSETKEKIVSAADSRVTVMVVPTNEELMIAQETRKVLESGK